MIKKPAVSRISKAKGNSKGVLMVGGKRKIGGYEEKSPVSVFVIYEGEVTEPDYFLQFNREYSTFGRFSLKETPKIGVDRNNTYRGDMVDLIDGYVKYKVNNKYTPFYLSTMVIEDCFDYVLEVYRSSGDDDDDNIEKPKGIKDTLYDIRNDIVDDKDLCSDNIDEDGFVIDYKKIVNAICQAVNNNDALKKLTGYENFNYSCEVESIIEKYHDKEKRKEKERKERINNVMKNTDEGNEEKNDENTDETDSDYSNRLVFVVFDRDFHPSKQFKRRDEDYVKYINKCRDRNRGYIVLMTNPAFELWLLMHHEGVDYDEVFKNGNNLTDVKRALFRLEDPYFRNGMEYDKTYNEVMKHISPDRYRDNYEGKFLIAYENSKCQFFDDCIWTDDKTMELIDRLKPGSTVGDELYKLINRGGSDTPQFDE